MAFGDLSNDQRVRVLLELLGGPQYAAHMKAAGVDTMGLARATKVASVESAAFTRRTFLQNQVLFTSRRLLFYATLGMISLGVAVIKLGFDFLNTMQQASVAFKGFLPGPRAVNAELRKLYVLAAITPFEFPDIVIATRRLLPFVKNLSLTNSLVKSITDSLAAVGVVTPAALTRASLAIAHMFAIGRVTGQVLYQLGRDNIPLQLALEKRFHMTGLAIRQQVAQGLITAAEAAQALNSYIRTTPGFINAAARQSRTMAGAWATFKDLLRFASGSSQRGLFSGLTRIINSINDTLLPLVRGGRPITLYQLAKAMDSTLTPSTHLLLNTFVFLQNVLAGVLFQFRAISLVVGGILAPFNFLTGGAHSQQFIMKLLGRAVSVLVVLWGLAKVRLVAMAFWTEINTLRSSNLLRITRLLVAISKLKVLWQVRDIASLKALFVAETVVWDVERARLVTVPTLTGKMLLLTRAIWTSVTALTVADIAAFWPIALIVAVTTLYLKWKKFHDIVQHTYQILTLSTPGITGLAPPGQPQGGRSWWQRALTWEPSWFKNFDKSARRFLSLPGAAGGGYFPSTRFAMVGEHGPEAVVLPGGSHVIPNHALGGLGGGVLNIRVVPQSIFLDSKKIGEAVATVVTDREARQ